MKLAGGNIMGSEQVLKITHGRQKLCSRAGIRIAEYFFACLSVICVSCMWLRYGLGFQYMFLFRLMIPVSAMFLVILKVVLWRKHSVSIEWLKYLLFTMTCVMFSVLNNINSISSALEILLPFLTFITIVYFFDKQETNDLCACIVNVMTVISVVSLFFYIFGSILHIISPSGSVQYEWGRTMHTRTYFGLYYEPQTSDNILSGTIRNCGIFGEATMYGYLLNTAYMLEKKSLRKRRGVLLILGITILSTLATMPILAFALYEGILFFTKRYENKQLNQLKFIFIPVILVVGAALALSIILDKMAGVSYGIRMDHMKGCFSAFARTFPFGLGFSESEALQGTFQYVQGLSVGIPYLLALGGVGGLLLFLIPSVRYAYYSFKFRKWGNVAFEVSFLVTFFFTNIVFNSTLQWLILAIFMRESCMLKRIRKENFGKRRTELWEYNG